MNYVVIPVASFGIKNKKTIGIYVQMTWIPIPKLRLWKEPEEMFRTEAKPAPKKELIVDPKLLIDMTSANRVPSIPGGHR